MSGKWLVTLSLLAYSSIAEPIAKEDNIDTVQVTTTLLTEGRRRGINMIRCTYDLARERAARDEGDGQTSNVVEPAGFWSTSDWQQEFGEPHTKTGIPQEERLAQLVAMLRDSLPLFPNKAMTYYLKGGSLIGALRQGNVIPWDYDVDLETDRSGWDALAAWHKHLPGRKHIHGGKCPKTHGYCWAAPIGKDGKHWIAVIYPHSGDAKKENPEVVARLVNSATGVFSEWYLKDEIQKSQPGLFGGVPVPVPEDPLRRLYYLAEDLDVENRRIKMFTYRDVNNSHRNTRGLGWDNCTVSKCELMEQSTVQDPSVALFHVTGQTAAGEDIAAFYPGTAECSHHRPTAEAVWVDLYDQDTNILYDTNEGMSLLRSRLQAATHSSTSSSSSSRREMKHRNHRKHGAKVVRK